MFLQNLPVDALWGVGPVTARKLRARGIEKLTDVRTASPELLRETVGSLADWLRQLARGEDDRAVVSEHEPKSSGSENTFERDLKDVEEIRREIAGMACDAAAWLVRTERYARTVTIKVRYHDFTTITRSHSDAPTRAEEAIVARALALVDKTEAGRTPIRLLGVSVHNLCVELDAPEPQARLPFDAA
jgi:DNA polymerase-4